MSRIPVRAGANLVGSSAIATLLAGGLGALAYVHPASAAKPNCDVDPTHSSCKPDEPDDGGTGGDDFLDASFDLTIEEPSSPGPWMTAVPDASGSNVYSDSKKDKVIVYTLNSSDGFRFDTNSQNTNKTRNFGSGRLVSLNLYDYPETDVEIDFRFNWLDGLDLGALVPLSGGVCQAVQPDLCSDVVAAQFAYFTGEAIQDFTGMQHGVLAFGALQFAPDQQTAIDCLDTAGMILATRTSDTTWTLESESGFACRFGRNASGDIECVDTVACTPEIVNFSLRFDLVMQ